MNSRCAIAKSVVCELIMLSDMASIGGTVQVPYFCLYLLDTRLAIFSDICTTAPVEVGRVTASTVSIRVPENCSTSTLPLPTTPLPLQGDHYYLLRGLQFGDPTCCPSITSIQIAGTGHFNIGVLYLSLKSRRSTADSYWIVANTTLYPKQTEYPLKIDPPLQMQCMNNGTIAVAIHCTPTGPDCQFNKTNQTYSLHATYTSQPPKSRVYSRYIIFSREQSNYHPVLSLSLSCEYLFLSLLHMH